jgi:hypothetical protein
VECVRPLGTVDGDDCDAALLLVSRELGGHRSLSAGGSAKAMAGPRES